MFGVDITIKLHFEKQFVPICFEKISTASEYKNVDFSINIKVLEKIHTEQIGSNKLLNFALKFPIISDNFSVITYIIELN